MSNTNNHGGSRPNSGPKPNAQLQHSRDLIDRAITEPDWLAAWKQIFNVVITSTDPRAKNGAMRLLCEYRFGKPTTSIEHIHIASDGSLASAQNESDDPTTAEILAANPQVTDPTDREQWATTLIDESDDAPEDEPAAVLSEDKAELGDTFDLAHIKKHKAELRAAQPEINFDPRPVPPAPPAAPSSLRPAHPPSIPPAPPPAPTRTQPKTNPKTTNPKPKSRRAHRRHNAKSQTRTSKPKQRIPRLTPDHFPRLTPDEYDRMKAGIAATIHSPVVRAAFDLPPFPLEPTDRDLNKLE